MNPAAKKQILFISGSSKLSSAVKKHLKGLKLTETLITVDNTQEISDYVRGGGTVLTLADQDRGRDEISEIIRIHREKDSDLPLIIITERDKQDEAAELIELGAVDYITTDNLKRLGPAVRREMKAYREVLSAKMARQEIKELMNIIESAEDEIYILGGDSYRIKFANKKALSNLGYDMKELYGRHIHDIAEEVALFDPKKDKTQNRVAFHTKFIRQDGTKYPAEAVFQMADTEGKTGILAMVQDITEKENVRQHAFILNKAIDASASAVTVIDENFKVIYVNKTQAKLAGRGRNEFIGRSIVDEPVYENSGTGFADALKKCLAGESWVGEYQKTGFDGEEYIVLGSVSPVFSDGINVTDIIIVEEDITETVRIKSQLLHAQKMETIGELTSGIAHDFTNMLTAIGGFASIMKRKMDKESRFYTYVEKISELTVRAKSLTKNLLTFSRKQMQAERVICVNTLVKSVGEFLSMVIGSRIELDICLSDEELNIVGDPVQLEQVIINLATNARDAIENDGTLTISTDKIMMSDEEATGGFREYAVIKVGDNGCGIEPERLSKIFEPFFTTKREGKGTGLGLYIVMEIISRHGGMIECNSEIGHGTEFTIKLPVTDRKVEENLEEAEVDSSSANVTILLVEDEKLVRESLAHALDVYGYDILEAVNGKEALEIFKEKSGEIDLMITDIVMPVMNGITAYKEMAAIKPDLKVIFTTGYVGEAHRKEGFNEEDHVVMVKPLTIKELVKKIEEMLNE